MKRFILPLSLLFNLALIGVVIWMHQRHVKIITEFYAPKDSVVTISFNKYKVFATHEEMFNLTPIKAGDIVFVGNSLTEGFPVTTIFNNLQVRNRGVSGNNTTDVLKRIEPIIKPKPAKVFLMLGINDIGQHVTEKGTFDNINAIVRKIRALSPDTEIIIQSILPMVGDDACRIIIAYNQKLKQLCAANQIQYIDLFPYFYDGKGLKAQYSFDGQHLTAAGYAEWTKHLKPYVN